MGMVGIIPPGPIIIIICGGSCCAGGRAPAAVVLVVAVVAVVLDADSSDAGLGRLAASACEAITPVLVSP